MAFAFWYPRPPAMLIAVCVLSLTTFAGMEPPLIEWERTFGLEETDTAQAVLQAADGGYIVAGTTGSFGNGHLDVYLMRTDECGHEIWSQTFGGAESDYGRSVQQTREGGYIVAGNTRSYGAGKRDGYLIKLAADSVTFKRGHTNSGAVLDISDAICLLLYLFGSPEDPCTAIVSDCLDAADANDDGSVDIADVITVLQYLFAGAGSLPPPFAHRGHDETADELGCDSFLLCEE